MIPLFSPFFDPGEPKKGQNLRMIEQEFRDYISVFEQLTKAFPYVSKTIFVMKCGFSPLLTLFLTPEPLKMGQKLRYVKNGCHKCVSQSKKHTDAYPRLFYVIYDETGNCDRFLPLGFTPIPSKSQKRVFTTNSEISPDHLDIPKHHTNDIRCQMPSGLTCMRG